MPSRAGLSEGATAAASLAPSCLLRGLVTRAEGSGFWVTVTQGDPGSPGKPEGPGRTRPGGQESTGQKEYYCVLRGRLKKQQLRVAAVVVVGDEVVLATLPDGGAVIEDRLPRRTELVRPGDSGDRRQHVPDHIIAANLDQLVIVLSAHQPDFKRRLAERYLSMAAHAGIEPLVVVNKCDLEEESVLRTWVEPLVSSGVRVILASAYDGRGLDELRGYLGGRVSGLAGQSGVGKSTLLNAMYPGFAIRTNAVSAVSSKGRHTTTSSRLYALPGGGYLADTPGIKSLGLFEEVDDEIGSVFPEIEAEAAGCRFRDCSHTHEPRCAVKEAVERGEIDEDRYRNYVRLRSRL